MDAALAEHGLAYRHLPALGHLAGNPDLSYAELARRSGLTTQSMQATLAQLQERGAVEQHNQAKRVLRAQLGITSDGAELLTLGTAAMGSVEQHLLASLPGEHRHALGPALLALFTAMLRETGENPGADGPSVRSNT